ncbi:MAG: L-fucose isomerase [Rikenellaceae bacterium]|nr:L-fucose isomerase [Rikenellaceae bacterium]
MMPKIGIRPIIDGREGKLGVRESLEEQTMGMAKNLAAFLSKELRYADGTPVQCVIADSTIGGVKEAAACAEKFSREGVGVSISVTRCWCYGTETIDMDPTTPKAIWGFNGTEKPGAVYLAAALAGHNQKGVPAFGIYGRDVQDADDTSIPEDVKVKLLRFAKAGLAVAQMKGKSYLSIGGVSMGIAGCIVQEEFFQNYLGMRNEYVDMSEVMRRLTQDLYDKAEYEKAMEWTKKNCHEGADMNPEHLRKTKAEAEEIWKIVVKMTLIIRDLMIGNPKLKEMGFNEESNGHNAIAAGFQGQRQWNDFMPDGDFSEAILNSSFDWNGIRKPFILATENDTLNGISMLFGNLLTNTAQVFADVRTFWSPEAIKKATGKAPTGLAKDGIIHLINSGSAALDGSGQMTKDGKPAMKPFWEIKEEEVKKCLDNTTWHQASLGYMRGGGYSSKFLTMEGMPITITRVNFIKGQGPVIQIAEGWTARLDPDQQEIIDKRTDPTWPTTYFVPRLTGEGKFKDVYNVMNAWGANHCAFSFGHIGADLITLASMLRIPVAMHNVPEQDIFRPTFWNAFGMDPEGSDYRACENLGPLY